MKKKLTYVALGVTATTLLFVAIFLSFGPMRSADREAAPSAHAQALPTVTPPGPPTPPLPTPTPEPPLTQAELEEFVESLCNNIELRFTDAQHHGGGRVEFSWDVSEYTGPHQGPRYADYELIYRIQRTDRVEGGAYWSDVVDVEGQTSWEKDGEPEGDWNYRIYLVAIEYRGEPHKCPFPITHFSFIPLQIIASPEELQNFISGRCRDLEITYLTGQAEWDRVSLDWETNQYTLPPDWRLFGGYAPVFSVEGRTGGTAPWDDLATVVGLTSWEGPALPGRAFYRVAVSGVFVKEQTFPCQGERKWMDVSVTASTVEERTKREYEREILIAEATRCAREALTSNISEDTLPIIREFVDGLVAQAAERNPEPDNDDEFKGFVITVCASASGDESAAILLSLLRLLDYGF